MENLLLSLPPSLGKAKREGKKGYLTLLQILDLQICFMLECLAFKDAFKEQWDCI